jgi:hypothetical protein
MQGSFYTDMSGGQPVIDALGEQVWDAHADH